MAEKESLYIQKMNNFKKENVDEKCKIFKDQDEQISRLKREFEAKMQE